MHPRDINAKLYGFPGLPKWLDIPLIKRTAERYGITEEESRERLRLNTLCELSPAKGETRGTETVIERNEPGAEACLRSDRGALPQEPQDAPEVSPKDGG